MAWFNAHILSIILFFPLGWVCLGGLLFLKSDFLIKLFYLFGAGILFFLGVILCFVFDPHLGLQLMQKNVWLKDLGIYYAVGIDAMSFFLILLSVFLLPLVLLSSWKSIPKKVHAFCGSLFVLMSTILGVLLAQDLFLFYFFWEAMLIPLFFLLGIWGGPERIYAAMKFFCFTFFGSLLMLVAILYLVSQHAYQFGGPSSFLPDLYRVKLFYAGFWSPQSFVFCAFAFAFSIKLPLFPLHTWLPDAHVQAPTAGSVFLAALLLKMGGVGFCRFCLPLFPEAVQAFSPFFLALSSIAILYGAWLAMVQTDMKKCVAYSSVSHMGFVMLGIFSLNPLGLTGAIFQMISHGISTAGLFLLVGMLYDRSHTREMAAFGGIAKVMPFYAFFFMLILLSSIALPTTNGFVGEFLILLGVFKKNPFFCFVSVSGVIFGAVYLLGLFQQVFFGPILESKKIFLESLKDLSVREWVILVPFVGLIFGLGLYPYPILACIEVSVKALLKGYPS